MKMNTLEYAQEQEDATFLTRVHGQNLSFSDILLAAPTRFLACSIDEVDLPKRFVTALSNHSVRTLSDLLSLQVEDLRGRNLGDRSLEAAKESLVQFLSHKIEQKSLVNASLREQMEQFAKDLTAREARIWEARMGLEGERYTLEFVGQRWDLTRERVRQIEAALFKLFDKKFPAVSAIREVARDGMTYSELVHQTRPLLDEHDWVPVASILENFDPKLHLVDGVTEKVLSHNARTSFEITLKKAVDTVELTFRSSERPLGVSQIVEAIQPLFAENIRQLALEKVARDGIWQKNLLLSPDRSATNVAIGILQRSEEPMRLEHLSDEIFNVIQERVTPETLRGSLNAIPAVRGFGYGTVGFRRHVTLSDSEIQLVLSMAEQIVLEGPEQYQWSAKDILVPINQKLPHIKLDHHQLNVIMMDSDKLAYLGRLTWTQKDSGAEQRKFYRDIFRSILERAKKPLPEDQLVEQARRERGLHLNVHLRYDSELIELKPKVWGLTRRDNPFSPKEVKALTKVFDASQFDADLSVETFQNAGIDTKGLKMNEILKVIEIHADHSSN